VQGPCAALWTGEASSDLGRVRAKCASRGYGEILLAIIYNLHKVGRLSS
jgi:hypothetical protein